MSLPRLPAGEIVFAVNRVRAHFEDDKGKLASIGTGFWVKSDKRIFFVTCKHVVDRSFQTPERPDLQLKQVDIELRLRTRSGGVEEKKFYTVKNLGGLRSSATADCAVFISPDFAIDSEPQRVLAYALRIDDLAEADRFKRGIEIMEQVYFIGFPGGNGETWVDSTHGLPIARSGIIASWPPVAFTNPGIKTGDTLLISGMSFSGSSGSPVIVPEQGFRPDGIFVDPSYRPMLVVGIMSGHWWEGKPPGIFEHSGLSYMTTSRSILELIRSG